ncbi:hypothetical protein H9Q13_01470 [Pontibacter sp. JH31]|uniref:Lipocalin-like domain-containing protein n=1 Tax=Pontibacter aquaedesilientis TaxID=2766980 RepID=A0ABR7XBZ6_9BACT|nr:hypothetical protein [Pontibacter aquaedesilientis]MBD1395820.1 hypothetical protein [Pontibacter aquaedesilientis]
MYTQRFYGFLLTFVFIVLLTGCDKDKEESSPTKSDLLTAGTWTGVSMFRNGEDVTQLLIEKENYDIKKQLWKYEKDGKYASTYERKALLGTWEFVDNEQHILHDKNQTDELSVRITKLTDKALILEYTYREKLYEERYAK